MIWYLMCKKMELQNKMYVYNKKEKVHILVYLI